MDTFNTINDLIQATRTAGEIVYIKGKGAINDGEGGPMYIQTAAQFGGTPDNVTSFAIADNNVAVYLAGSSRVLPDGAGLAASGKGFYDVSPRIPRLTDGRLDFWIEGDTQTTSGFGSSTMWRNENIGSTKVTTQEELTLGVDIPSVPTAKFYSRTVVTSIAGSSNFVRKTQRIEGVRTYAGQTIVISLFGRVDAAKNVAVELVQNFGTGGSPSAEVTGIGSQKILLTTDFERKSAIFDVPDLSGKTIGTDGNDYLEFIVWFDAGSNFNSRTDNLGQQDGTFDVACFQDDIGTEIKPFYEFGPKESVDRLNRHFENLEPNVTGASFAIGRQVNVINCSFVFKTQVEMRAPPQTQESAGADFVVLLAPDVESVSSLISFTSENSVFSVTYSVTISGTFSAAGAGAAELQSVNTNAFIRFDSRL